MVGKRKFVSEFSVSITSKGWLMFTPDQLHADGKMNDELQGKVRISGEILLG